MSITINPEAYVFSTDGIPDTPSIDVDMYTVTSAGLDSACSAYLALADEYASAHQEVLTVKSYVEKRLSNDLAAQCVGLTSAGINKETNKIVLHQKANEVYEMASGSNSLRSQYNISQIASNYDTLHAKVCMSDLGDETSLVAAWEEEETYDTRAITIDDDLYINEIPNAIGNERQFTTYTAELTSGVYVNTPVYVIDFEELEIGESSVECWVKKTPGSNGEVIKYAEALDSAWTAYSAPSEEESSSSSDEA